MRRHLLGVRAAADEPKHAIADGEIRDPFAERVDLAGEFEAGDVGRHVGRRGVHAEALNEIGAVDGGGAHSHAHLAA